MNRPQFDIMKLRDLQDTRALPQIARQAIKDEAEKDVIGANLRLAQSGLEPGPRIKWRAADTGIDEGVGQLLTLSQTNSLPRSIWVSIEAGFLVYVLSNARKARRA